MHAIYSTAQRPCIYMQLEPSTCAFEEDEPEEADDEEKTPEIMLVPANPSTCESSPYQEIVLSCSVCAAIICPSATHSAHTSQYPSS